MNGGASFSFWIISSDIDREFARQVYRAHLARTRPRRNLVMEESKQCFGIDCVNETRPGSKYCSDDCGRSIARARLMKFLPQAVQEYWEHIPSAEVREFLFQWRNIYQIRYQSMAKEKQNQITYIQGELDKLKGMATMLERYANVSLSVKMLALKIFRVWQRRSLVQLKMTVPKTTELPFVQSVPMRWLISSWRIIFIDVLYVMRNNLPLDIWV